ncbi:UDP-N-acetylglucosamine 2-epimerase (non-hydrolyzing) [Paenibacillus sp. FSL R5-0407]|uniref:non-hydrolyzing UDP-N-acetylglucosamine 2-epimerase n=1 Tax=Paenibacillus sp. FSL R5-0407 TaxID=2975320 RepID=UPI0030FC93FD
MKVMTILGTRPEIIKLCCVIAELDKFTDHILVHTGQNYDYELNEIFFEEMNIRKPDVFLKTAGANPSETIGNVIIKSDEIFKQYRPDALLLYGDTNSCLSVISAKRNKIPIFHMEAGNRCFDHRVPEEVNRKIVDHLSDVNMTLTEHARRYLISEGLPPELIFKTGSSMNEVLNHHSEKIHQSKVLDKLNLKYKDYFVVSAHREENIESLDNINNLIRTLNGIAETYHKRVIVSTHPRTRKRLDQLGIEFNKLIEFMKPLGFADYIQLQRNAYCVISDSGTITEEASLLRFPAITIREAHERPEGMDEGTLIMSGLCLENVLLAIDVVVSQHVDDRTFPQEVKDYEANSVAKKVVRIIMSYTDYINQTVWKIRR